MTAVARALRRWGTLSLLVVGWSVAAAPDPATPAGPWKTLQPGVEYAVIALPPAADLAIDPRLHVVRIDPARATLDAAMAGAGDGRTRPAGDWCRDRKLAVAINLGMYKTDRITNTGYARAGTYVNNGRWSDYKAALAFAPKRPDSPAVFFADLDVPTDKERLEAYGTVVQDLRLIRAPGKNVWTKQDRRWSEAAVAVDRNGRVLFIFSRYPRTMKALNDLLLSLPLGITAAMHVEGGPEASLSIHAGGVDVDLGGSYETGFNENDAEHRQWPIPNVLGVRRAPTR
jgi:hypothetical protein